MAALVTAIDPGRGRDGDTGIDIIGTGFDPTTNTVTVDGVSATVTFNSATLVTFTCPAGIALDQWVVVELTNTGDSSVASRKWWSKQTVASLDTVRLDGEIPGPFENDITENPQVAEGKNYERIVTFLEFIRGNALSIEQQSQSTSTTITLSKNITTVLYTTSGGDRTADLPSGHTAGQKVTFKKITTANSLTIDADASETIDGELTYTIPTGSLGAVTLESDGTNWHVVGTF